MRSLIVGSPINLHRVRINLGPKNGLMGKLWMLLKASYKTVIVSWVCCLCVVDDRGAQHNEICKIGLNMNLMKSSMDGTHSSSNGVILIKCKPPFSFCFIIKYLFSASSWSLCVGSFFYTHCIVFGFLLFCEARWRLYSIVVCATVLVCLCSLPEEEAKQKF